MNMQGKKGKEGMGKREYVKGMGKGSERGVGKREGRVGEGGGRGGCKTIDRGNENLKFKANIPSC